MATSTGAYSAKDTAVEEPSGAYSPNDRPADAKPASTARRAADTGLALGRGIVAIPEAAVGVADIVTGGRAGKAVERLGVRFKDAKQVLTDAQSAEQKAADAQVQQADGFLPTLGAMVRNPSTIVNAAAESVPSMLAGGALSRGLVNRGLGAITAGAAGEAAVSAGSSAEQVRQESPTGFLTPKQAALAATSGAATGIINRASGQLADKLGISDVNTALATGKLGGATEKGVARRVAEGAVNEGVLQELPQSAQEQAMQNIALDRPVGEGVAQAAASGMLVGGLTGAGFGAVSGGPEKATTTTEDPSLGRVQPPRVPPGVIPSEAGGGNAAAVSPPAAPPPAHPAPPAPPAAPAPSRAQAMGINPTAGPLQAAAGVTVGTGADLVTQQQEVDRQRAEAQSKEKAKPGEDGKTPEPQAPAPVQPATPDPTAPVTGPFTQAIHGGAASNVTPPTAPVADPQDAAAAIQPVAGSAADAPAAPGVGADQGPQGAGPVPAALPEPVTEVPPVTQPPTQESTNASTAEVIDPETGEITRPGPQGEGGDGVQRPADAVQPGADAKGPQPAADEPAAPAGPSAAPQGKPAAPTETVNTADSSTVGRIAQAKQMVGEDELLRRARALANDPRLINPGAEVGGVPADAVALEMAARATVQGYWEEPPSSKETVKPAAEPAAKPPALTTPVDMGAHTAATSPLNDRPEPTQAQKEAGNYKKAHLVMNGLEISIENPEGSTRSGVDADGKPWSNTMTGHYGYIKRTTGSDGEQQDVYVKPGTPLDYAGPVFVVDQIDPKTGKHDEFKSMVGYKSPMEARKAYMSNYAKDWAGLKSIKTMTWDEFKAWLGGEAGKKPLPRKGKQADGGTVRGMDYTGRPIDGKPVNAGDIFATSSGRQTTPYPSSKRQQAASQWLIDNAIAEATSRDDTMNAAVFGNEKPMKDGSLPPASQDSMLEYLFGQQPAVPKSILKPLAPASNAGGAAATQEQAAADKEPTSKAPAKPTGGKNLRGAAYERNPLLTFLAKHGLFHDKDKPGSQKSEFSPDRQVMVMGYGPVFRKNGRQLDELLPLAIQDGYLPPGSNEADLANLIASAIRGNRVAPMFTDDGAEKAAALRDQRDREDYERKQAEVFADLDRQASEELEGALADLTDAEFSTLRAELLDGPVADIDAESNTDVRSAMKALGFTDQEIDDATAQGQGAPGQDGAGRSGPAEAAGQGQGEGAQQGVDATAEGSQDDEGLTSPTRDDVIAQQDRAENAQALDDKAQIDREAEGFQLQAQTVDTRTDTTGDMFGGPSVDDYQQDMARRRKPGTEPQGPSLFDQPAEPEPAAPAAANPDALRAQADLQNALADLADIFGKNTRANMMPEQEQKMLPVLVKVFDAAFRLGYHKFKDAAKFALDQIRKALGDDAANAITLDHLQGAYISMSGGRPQADTKRAVIDVEDKADIESHVATKGDGPDIVKTYPATAASATARTRPRDTITFQTPIKGPSGSSLVSYTWQWRPMDVVDSRGEDRTVRVSDWDKADVNAETGREIVHQFVVAAPDGSTQTVSAETAVRLLGFAGDEAAPFKSATSAAKTLARLRMQAYELGALVEQFTKDHDAVKAMRAPSPTSERNAEGWFEMGDAKVRQLEPGPMIPERLRALTSAWRDNRLQERGWKSGEATKDLLGSQVADIGQRIKRAEKKVASLGDGASPATQATTILDAAKVTGKDRLDITKDVKAGALTPDEVQAAFPSAEKPQEASQPPAWHTAIPEHGTLAVPADEKNYSQIPRRVATEAVDAVTRTQSLGNMALYAYVLPAANGYHGAVRLFPDDQTPPAPWSLLFPEAVRMGMLTRDQAIDKLAEPLRRAPVLGDVKQAGKIEDVGEKIGGARKDTATSTGPKASRATDDDRPAWARRFVIGEALRPVGQINAIPNEGRWVIRDKKNTDFMGQPKQVGRMTFATKEDAEAALPLLAVSLKHRVRLARSEDGKDVYEIWRDIGERKSVKVVDRQFESNDAAKQYMAENAVSIIEANTTFGEADLPIPESKQRIGEARRSGNVTGESFRDVFGFRAVEFGNWNNQEERQQVMNEAYDGLLDLAEVMGIPPKAIGLNGDLALAFGARGQGLHGARAHYENRRAVINLTKMDGAGALAHEWFHALDHYFGRQDGKTPGTWKTGADGTRTFDAKGGEADMASGGFLLRGSGVRKEIQDAYQGMVKTMFKKAATYVEDTEKADQFVAATREQLAEQLNKLRAELSAQKDVRYYKRKNAPAPAEMLAEFDEIASKFLAGEFLDTEIRYNDANKSKRMTMAHRWTNDALDKINAIYKETRGRSGFNAEQNGWLDGLRGYMTRYSQRLKMLADAQQATEKTKSVPTEFAMDAKSLDQGRGKDYWTTPHEMLARAFQGYVEDKIAEKGGKSPFLNYAPANSGILTPWGWKRPYPYGEERKAINGAIDKFVKALETQETEGGNVLIREPDAPYEADLFGDPLPAAPARPAPAGPGRAAVRRNVQPVAGVQDTPAPAGEYFASTIVGSEVSRELGARRITTPEQAAQATTYLYRSAVERMDGIVTDANGKPLGIVGGFKGALSQTSVYPATLMAEAIRIPGAARIWFSHNHPSGNPQLSRADENLSQVLSDVFNGSGIEPMGLLAIGSGRFSHIKGADIIVAQPIPASTGTVSVPVIERTLAPNGVTGMVIGSPQAAKQYARDFYDRTKKPGLMLLDSQNAIIGWVPVTDQMKGELRGTGGLNAVYRAISESNAGAAIIVHGGELGFQSLPKQFPRVTPSENIAAALSRIDVRPLDSIEVLPTSTKSAAEVGRSIADGPVFARGNPFYSALTAELSMVNAAAQPALGWANTINGLVKAGKVKQDEVDWSGVLDWLKMQPGKVTREQVAQFLQSNGVRVTETVLGTLNTYPGFQDDVDLLERNGFTLERNPEDANVVAFMDEGGDLLSADDMAAFREGDGITQEAVDAAYRVERAELGNATGTKYAHYQLPGGTNYREVLLTLPGNAYRYKGKMRDLSALTPDERNRFKDMSGFAEDGNFADAAELDEWQALFKKTKEAPEGYKSSHWDQPNVLAHIRVNDRVDADGKKVLFIEEIQSDWGQEGKRKGFTSAANPMKAWKIIDANGDGIGSGQGTSEAAAIADWRRVAGNRANLAVRAEVQPDSRMEMRGTPAAPFVTKTDAWLALALKRIVKMAVDEGYDRVAFINGEQSAERYDLSKRVEEIRHLRQQDGTYDLAIKQEGSRPMVTMNGRSLSGLKESDLEELVGKEIAKKIVAQEGPRGGDGFHKLSGLDLKVGGEGMKAFYDKIVPNTLKDVLRKVGGGALEVVDMGGPDRERRHALIRERRTLSMDDPRRAQLDGEIDLLGRIESGVMAQMKQPGFTVTPAMKERAAGGLPLFGRSTAAVGGIPAQKVRLMAAPIAKRLHIDLRVVDTPAGLPIAAPADAVGLYHNGTIWIVASNVNTRQDIMKAIAHEAVAHLGLRQLLEPAEYRQLMSMINAGAAAGGNLAEIRASIRKTYVDQNGRFNLSPMAEADEIAARVAELGVDADGNFRPGFEWLKAIFAKVAQWLRSKGLDIPFTNAELQGMLVRAQTHLERGPEAAGQVGAAFARRSDRADVRRMNENQVEREIRLLMPRVERAYESGDLALAERLDARLETLMDAMETNLLEMQEDTLDKAYDGFNRAVLEKEGQEGDIEADLVIDLANRWIEITKPGSWEAKEYPTDVERAAHLRELLGEYAYRHGGLKDNLSDEMIIEAAKDAAASVYAMRKARQDRARAKALTEYRPDDMTPEQRDAVLASMERAGEAKFADQRAQREAASRFAGEQTPIPEWMRATQFMRRESPEFKAWFGDSKVVDADGKPLVVYHGTAQEMVGGAFNRDMAKSEGGAFYFSHSPLMKNPATNANDYARNRSGDSPNVVPVYLRMENPLITGFTEPMPEGDSAIAAWLGRMNDFNRGLDRNKERYYKQAIREARANGHDGVIIRNVEDVANDAGRRFTDEADVYIAFDPEQIKSAIGNRGTFDPANPDIRFSRKPTAAEAIKLAGERTGNTAAHYRGLGLQALGRRQITELYGNILPQLPIYSKLMAQMDADKNEAGAEADQIAQDWGKLKDERQLAELMHEATLAQMDPERPLMRGDDPFTYDRLRAQFVALSPEARKVYVEARDTYRTHHENVRKAIRDRIERSELRGQRKAELLQQMDSEFYKAIKGVYFPLARFGDYVVIVRDPTGKTLSVNRAETINEAQALQESLRQSYPGMTVGKVLKSKEFNAGRDAVGRGFMQNLYEALGRADMDDMQRGELEDMLGQLYLSALPDLSWAKHGIHRKGTPGFSQDARRAFAQNTFHGARYLAKVRYSDLLENELIDAQKQVDALADSDSYDSVKAQQVIDEMVKRHDAAMNPNGNALSTALTSVGFVFHLGLSPASAMVNLTQTALVALPLMGSKWGFSKSTAALLKASQQAASNGNDISKVLSTEERRAFDEAVRSGVIDVTMAHDLAGISQGEDAKVAWKMRPVMRWASFLFHHAEKFNRQVTFVAAYRLAREAGTNAKQAYEQAVKATYDGHFDYSASNRPRIMQGNVAKVVLLFKQYGQNMVYTLSRQAYLAMKGRNPYERAQARRALGGLLAMHGAAAGVLGLPMVSTLLAAASFLGGDDDEPWDAEVALRNMLADALGDQAADVLARGLSRLTPWDISGRVGLDKLILPDIQEGLEGQDLANSAMAAALGPVAGIGISLIKGMQEISDGHWLRGLEAMAPSLARGPLKALRYGTEGAIDRTGKPIVEEVGAAGVVGQALGFSPSEVRLATEAKSAVHQADQRLNKRRALLLRHYSMAVIMGDEEGAADARQEILAFNEKNPQRRINPLQMARSVATRKKQIAMSQGGVYLPRSHKDAMQAGQFGME